MRQADLVLWRDEYLFLKYFFNKENIFQLWIPNADASIENNGILTWKPSVLLRVREKKTWKPSAMNFWEEKIVWKTNKYFPIQHNVSPSR